LRQASTVRLDSGGIYSPPPSRPQARRRWSGVALLLAEAERVGLRVQVDGVQLVIRGPRRAEPVARRLLEARAELLEHLRSCARAPHAGSCGELVIPFHSDESFHWWKARDLEDLKARFRAVRIAAGLPAERWDGFDA
jgi:hypothetical protein